MMKIAHVLTGVVALLLSLVPSLRGEVPFLLHADAVCLALIGLLNVQFASSMPRRLDRQGQRLTAAAALLLLFAAPLQAVALLLPPTTSGGQAATLTSLLLVLAAVALQLATTQLRSAHPSRKPEQVRPATAPVPHRAPTRERGREIGTVKWFNTSKGFGFISRDKGEDVFVHFRAIRGEGHRALIEGQRVQFMVTRRERGLQAEDVVILDR